MTKFSLKNESNKLGNSSLVKPGYGECCLLPSMLFANLKVTCYYVA